MLLSTLRLSSRLLPPAINPTFKIYPESRRLNPTNPEGGNSAKTVKKKLENNRVFFPPIKIETQSARAVKIICKEENTSEVLSEF